jgi:ribosomal protein S18 acetylase RimI-like enzyme
MPAGRIGSLRRGDLAAAAGVDRRAFGARWCHDVEEIDQIRDATPHARARVSFERAGPFGRELLAFAISGAAGEHGYLQRLAVDPSQQRSGHGRALTVDALRWMARRRLRDCLVNTSIANSAALALYRSIGFHPLDEQLEVLELDVRAVR